MTRSYPPVDVPPIMSKTSHGRRDCSPFSPRSLLTSSMILLRMRSAERPRTPPPSRDRRQRPPLSTGLRLAPTGWTVDFFKVMVKVVSQCYCASRSSELSKSNKLRAGTDCSRQSENGAHSNFRIVRGMRCYCTLYTGGYPLCLFMSNFSGTTSLLHETRSQSVSFPAFESARLKRGTW